MFVNKFPQNNKRVRESSIINLIESYKVEEIVSEAIRRNSVHRVINLGDLFYSLLENFIILSILFCHFVLKSFVNLFYNPLNGGSV